MVCNGDAAQKAGKSPLMTDAGWVFLRNGADNSAGLFSIRAY
jgi:hypothetical protein